MSNRTTIGPVGRVLLGASGEADDWRDLHAHLGELGWRVDLFDASPRLDGDGPEASVPSLDGVDVAILILGKPAPGTAVAERLELHHLVGVMQGRLGEQRVVVLDENHDPLLERTGVHRHVYESGNVAAVFPEISDVLHSISAAPQRSPTTPWPERFGIAEGRIAPELWLGLGPLMVFVALAFVIGYQLLDDTVGDEETQTIEETGPVLPPAGPVPSTPISDAGRVGAFPAACTVSIPPGGVVPREIPCDGAGGLLADGFLGPWHNEVSSISVDPGVVASVTLTSQPPDAGARIQLRPVPEQSLEPYDSLAGVDQIDLEFSSNGQQVVLHQREDRGGNRLTLTFTLDL